MIVVAKALKSRKTFQFSALTNMKYILNAVKNPN